LVKFCFSLSFIKRFSAVYFCISSHFLVFGCFLIILRLGFWLNYVFILKMNLWFLLSIIRWYLFLLFFMFMLDLI
jgi:hypothetical protein